MIYSIIAGLSLVEFSINEGKSDMGTIGLWVIMLLGVVLYYFGVWNKLYYFNQSLYVEESDYLYYSELYPVLIFILLNIIFYFIVGYLVGFFIEKIKKRKVGAG